MLRIAICTLIAGLTFAHGASAQQNTAFDYWRYNRDTVWRGMQALMMCNGLFTSGRTLEQIFAQELKYLPKPIGTAAGGDYSIDRGLKAVAVGAPGYVPVMRAAFRPGIGCVVLAPDQDFADIDVLPRTDQPVLPGDPAAIDWPDGDRVPSQPLPEAIDATALEAASRWTFERESPEQVTLSLLIIYRGQIIHERYAPGVNMHTRTRTWSTAKSIASTLIGVLVDDGRLALDEPLNFSWLPQAPSSQTDPRHAITLRNLLHMSSGLETVDNAGLEYAIGSGMAYWAGASSVAGALSRPLFRQPGTHWDYENYDTLLAILAMKQALLKGQDGAAGDESIYREFPRRALFDRIGMRNTLPGTDRFGDFIFSSQVYTNARDLGRFGLLYQQGGIWNGERILSKEWIDFVRTPAPTARTGRRYGGQWWLVPEDRADVPGDAYSTSGNRGQYVVVAPSHDLVIVRRGLDYGSQGFNRWDLLREVLKIFEARDRQ